MATALFCLQSVQNSKFWVLPGKWESWEGAGTGALPSGKFAAFSEGKLLLCLCQIELAEKLRTGTSMIIINGNPKLVS